jgi:hypothetical protein
VLVTLPAINRRHATVWLLASQIARDGIDQSTYGIGLPEIRSKTTIAKTAMPTGRTKPISETRFCRSCETKLLSICPSMQHSKCFRGC